MQALHQPDHDHRQLVTCLLCSSTWLTTPFPLCLPSQSLLAGLQGVADAEEEATRRGVQAAAARKAVHKALADAAQADKQITGLAEELEAKQAEFSVSADIHVIGLECC